MLIRQSHSCRMVCQSHSCSIVCHPVHTDAKTSASQGCDLVTPTQTCISLTRVSMQRGSPACSANCSAKC